MNKEKSSKKEKGRKLLTVNIENNPIGLFPDINRNNNANKLKDLNSWSKD